MDHSTLDQYFELALDLPEPKREQLLARLTAEEPELAAALRTLLANPRGRGEFACTTGRAGQHAPARLCRDTLHHVALQVRDIAAAVKWYREVLSCDVEYQDKSWAMLQFDNVRIALVVPEQHPPHVAVVRPDAARFGALTAHRDGTRSVYIVDPWGNSIEVLDQASLPDTGGA